MSFVRKILRQIQYYPNRIALCIGGQSYTYRDFFKSAFHISKNFIVPEICNPVCLILSEKTIHFFTAFFACLLSNSIYTPINLKSPFSRNKLIIQSANPDIIFIGKISITLVQRLLSCISKKIVIVSDKSIYLALKQSEPQNFFIFVDINYFSGDVEVDFLEAMKTERKDIAYLFFTSGSTGFPKGVPISYRQLDAYLISIFQVVPCFTAENYLQCCDLAFDLSIHEMLVCWLSAGTLFIYDEDQSALGLLHFIESKEITHCLIVPTMLQTLIEQSNYFSKKLPLLKSTLLCGEPLPMALCYQWLCVSPYAEIVNLYGPTEATIACSNFPFDKKIKFPEYSIAPIGKPFPSAVFFISENQELCISGDQVGEAYWCNSVATESAFILETKTNSIFYRTGDRVMFDSRLGYIYLGRMDDQWQIQGYRIEKNEIECCLRSVIGLSDIYVVPQCDSHGLVKGVIAVSKKPLTIEIYYEQLSACLPRIAIPKCIKQLDKIPLLPNNKIDYRKTMIVLGGSDA